jgi:cytosine deaminase
MALESGDSGKPSIRERAREMRMDRFMAMAIEEASATKAEGGSPFGAVLVRAGQIIGRGRNLMIQNKDPLSHGEMEAIKAAGL